MRKNLGSKRREIPEAARHEIVRIYAEMLNGVAGHDEFSKIFDTTAFGYREIRIERPLRLSFQATPERLTRLAEEKAIQRLESGERQERLHPCPETPRHSHDRQPLS
jgi:type I restriction enzyme M protein